MTHRSRTLAVLALLLAGPAWIEARATGAVDQDPQWVRMWTAAQRHQPADLAPAGRIAPATEPGTPLVVSGRVLQPDGRTPAAGAVVFAYQTDAAGVYSSPGQPGRPWRLQGWAETDGEGRYEFRTIRPAGYPGSEEPAHIHLTVVTTSYGRQWTEELRFDDDPRVTALDRRQAAALGPFGGIRHVEVGDGGQRVTFDIRLKPQGDF